MWLRVWSPEVRAQAWRGAGQARPGVQQSGQSPGQSLQLSVSGLSRLTRGTRSAKVDAKSEQVAWREGWTGSIFSVWFISSQVSQLRVPTAEPSLQDGSSSQLQRSSGREKSACSRQLRTAEAGDGDRAETSRGKKTQWHRQTSGTAQTNVQAAAARNLHEIRAGRPWRVWTGPSPGAEDRQQELAGGLLLTQAGSSTQQISSHQHRDRDIISSSDTTCSITQIRKPYPSPRSEQSIFHVETV